jgi:exodeoxyribonuclease III
LRILTLNLNGIRSAAAKGFFTWAAGTDADIICLQEVRAQTEHLSDTAFALAGYRSYFHLSTVKKAYSGVAIYTRHTPDRVIEGFGHAETDAEGRYLQLDFGQLSVASVYLPSGSSGPERQAVKFALLDRIQPWLDAKLTDGRSHVLCGDFNIAHRPVDLKNWRGNQKNSGFLPEERAWVDKQLNAGWVDTHRVLAGDATETYTWWSNRGQAYAKNVGWRIDYQWASADLRAKLARAEVYNEMRFSDHAPLIVDYTAAFAALRGVA